MKTCKVCRQKLVHPWGDEKSEILIAGEFPGDEEIAQGRPFVGAAGEILRVELARAGLSLDSCRLTNLWLHKPEKDEAEVSWHAGQLLSEMQGRKYALLLGSEFKSLYHQPVSLVNGLQVESSVFPEGVRVMAAVNPAIVFHRSIGEFRLALEKFVKMVRGDYE